MSGTQASRGKLVLGTVAAVGAGVVIGAAGLYLYNTLVQKKELKLLQQHVARLEMSLSVLHEEFASLRDSRHLNKSKQSTSSISGRSIRNSFSSSRSGYDTEDDMFTALDTDDEQFFDLNSEDEDTFIRTLQEDSNSESSKVPKILNEVDILMKGGDEDRLNAFNLLKKYEFEMSENPEFLWRYAKAYQMRALACGAQQDMETKKKYVYEGLGHATKALALDDTNPDVHKWFAILTGMETDFVSIKQKIQNGYLFQKHVRIAIDCKPEDYSLHHLLGRFKFEVANTSWVEKKLASSLFAEIPDVTYSDAITDLLTAEDLNPTPWKENRLLLARCYIGDGQYDKAIEWLDSAKKITSKTKDDAACDQEVNTLLEKYKKYRK